MAVSAGHYAQKQILSRSGLVRWTHGSRFRTGRALVAPHAGRRLLDYGSGDGTFLVQIQDLFPNAVGADVALDQVEDCRRRFASVPGMLFVPTDALTGPAHAGRYDVVVCMEVLEHCPDDVQVEVLDRIKQITTPGGVVVISVPIEIGPPLVAKQLVRAMVALSGLKEYAYRERYRPGELMTMLFAGKSTVFPRQENIGRIDATRTTRYTGHKGFNWRKLQELVRARFTIERRLFSPLPHLGPWCNSQVWFVCRKLSTARDQ
jgi:2-polyprenyl-3-methyl-5-hydroxy-6-metoxy-1,4-benzoquinol methylase